MTMKLYQDDFTYYYYGVNGSIVANQSLGDVPMDIKNYAKLGDAVSFFQQCGCMGRSAHTASGEYHRLCLEVLAIGIERHGDEIHVYRGSQSDTLKLSEHKILYGAISEEVAAWYGPVSRLTVRGLVTNSRSASVLSPDDLSSFDEEVVFMPSGILQYA